MFATVALLCSIWGMVCSSGLHAVAPAGAAPIVTAASSQYFERTFNRLVAATPVFQPVFPVAPAPLPPPIALAPVRPIQPTIQPVFQPEVVDAIRTSEPTNPTDPPQSQNPVESNVAIAIATAHAAAPVATILLPPYPFGFPSSFGLIPQPTQVPSENPKKNRETTTRLSTTIPTTTTTTERQQETITQAPSNIDNSFAQALPSNENNNFRQYYAPPAFPGPKPQKLKTTVEVVPVPLRYIAPPPLNLHHHHQHHSHHHHQAIKVVPHFHTFIPNSHKIIIRPMSRPLRTISMRIPAPIMNYGTPKLIKKVSQNYSQNIRNNARDTEPTTFRPINKPMPTPPRL